MPRKRTGTVQPYTDATGLSYWRARIRLSDGSRPWLRVPEAHGYSEERAREWAASMQEREDNEGKLAAAKAEAMSNLTGETLSTYADRWLRARQGHIASVRDNRGHLEGHILPVIGTVAMTDVCAADIERLVDALDAKVEAGEIGAKTAKNIFGTCTKLFDDATHAKPAEGLRCLTADPTDKVRGPDDDEADKALQFLYPSEFLRFVECDLVPLDWRRNLAIGIYLCLRDGEQRALRWSSVDLEHGTVMIEASYDRRSAEVKEGTKTGAARLVLIPEPLMPLLKAMHEESGGEGLVTAMPSLRHMSRGLRKMLLVAGVKRTQLHTSSTVSRPMRWHDARSSGLTWHAVAGKPATEIRDIAGHTQVSMTDRYIRSATMLRGGRFGEVFPALPAALCVVQRSNVWSNGAQVLEILERETGFEPATSSLGSLHSTN